MSNKENNEYYTELLNELNSSNCFNSEYVSLLVKELIRSNELMKKDLEDYNVMVNKIIYHALNGSRTELHLSICELRFRFPPSDQE